MGVNISVCRWPNQTDDPADIVECLDGDMASRVIEINEMRLHHLVKNLDWKLLEANGISVDRIYMEVPNYFCDIRNLNLKDNHQAQNFVSLLSQCGQETGWFMLIS